MAHFRSDRPVIHEHRGDFPWNPGRDYPKGSYDDLKMILGSESGNKSKFKGKFVLRHFLWLRVLMIDEKAMKLSKRFYSLSRTYTRYNDHFKNIIVLIRFILMNFSMLKMAFSLYPISLSGLILVRVFSGLNQGWAERTENPEHGPNQKISWPKIRTMDRAKNPDHEPYRTHSDWWSGHLSSELSGWEQVRINLVRFLVKNVDHP